jgi:uncharacterized protein
VRFWDASALVPLVFGEATSEALQALASKDSALLVWWASEVECASAIARLSREGVLDDASANRAFGRLRELADVWHEVDANDAVREAAVRFLRVHALRAAAALQLAAAFVAAKGRPSSLDIVTLDDRLSNAARKEGFAVVEIEPAI